MTRKSSSNPQVAAVLSAEIRTLRDWVDLSRRARDLLVSGHGYSLKDFHKCQRGDEPALNWSSRYPEAWRGAGLLGGWLNFEPVGVWLWWPEGCDVYGEAHDPECAVELLAEVDFWTNADDSLFRDEHYSDQKAAS